MTVTLSRYLACFALLLALRAGGAAASTDAPDPVPPQDNAVVLRVDGEAYTYRDLSSYVEFVLQKTGAEKENPLRFLEELVVDLVVYDDAVAEMPSLKDDPYVTQSVRRFMARSLPNVLWEEDIRREVNPTPEEIARRFPDPEPKYEISVIVNESQEKILEAERVLASGKPFGEVARSHSQGFNSEKGGKVSGGIQEGRAAQFTKAEFDTIRELKEGEHTVPFQSRIGWLIVRLDKHWTPAELKAREVEANYRRYVEEERGKAYQSLLDGLYSRTEIAWDNAVVDQVRARLEKSEPLPEALRATAIVRVNGVGIYPLDLDDMGKVHSLNALDTYLDRKIREEILLQETLRRGYVDRISRETGIARKRATTRRFFQVKAASFAVGEKDLREYYESNPDRFRTEERRKITVVETDSRKKADEILKKARKGQDMGKLAERYNLTEESRKEKGNVGYVTRKMLRPDVAEKVFSMKKGAVSGPVEFPGKDGARIFAVVRVEEVVPAGRVPFGEIDRARLSDKIRSGRMQEFYKEFLAKASRGHKVERGQNDSNNTGAGGGKNAV